MPVPICTEWQVDDPRLELAFTQVRREDFLGPGPWVIPRWIGESRGRPAVEYVPTPSADPVYLYVDNVVQVIAERNLNNGQPSGHAKWITSASIKAGEHVVHIGTGTGYYTAIMASLVGPSGKVTGPPAGHPGAEDSQAWPCYFFPHRHRRAR